MSIYFVTILDGGEFWAAVMEMRIHALALACISFWFLEHVFVCALLAAEVNGRDNRGIIRRGVLRTYGLAFVPTEVY